MQGMMGVFRELDAATETVKALRAAKVGKITAYTPTPRHEFEEAFGDPPSNVRKFTLIGGLCGATFGWWIAIWCSDYWPLVVGGKAVASWLPYTIIGFATMVLVGALSTVAGMFVNSRVPKITMTVGFDPRFTHGDYGIWVPTAPDRAKAVEETMRRHGAVEVRHER